jgi:pheromone shutdown protein TraB
VGLMEERDAVLAHNIRRACQGEGGREVVVVLGAAHVNGVRRLLMQS